MPRFQYNANSPPRGRPLLKEVIARRVSRATSSLSIALLAVGLVVSSTTISRADVNASDVDRAIEKGRQALLSQIRMEDVIRYQKPGSRSNTARGTVTQRRGGVVVVDTGGGQEVRIGERYITEWQRGGFVRNEARQIHYGGRTALACLALLYSDLELSEPRFKRCLDALTMHPLPEAGTYVRALRVSIWSHLLSQRRLGQASRRAYERLLERDMTWLEREMQPSGAYDYGFDLGDGDSSNTQFAHLGLWRGNLAGAEVARARWQRIEQFWLKTQQPSGGWSYIPGNSRPSSSMTVAGCNSLYIVLDRLYARADRAYRPLRGCQPNRVARKKIEKVFAAIQAGDEYLNLHPYDPKANKGYELFGIERLGLASGQAAIGNRNWYQNSVEDVCDRDWNTDVIADAFSLIFLVHGQAPILFQKLAHSEVADEWNYYFRDLHGLTQYFNNTFERLHRWQYVPSNASLNTIKHAPFLLISGSKSFKLPPTMRERLARYIADGGVLIFHADLNAGGFVKAARREIEAILEATPWPLRDLPIEHPLFSCQFDITQPGLRPKIAAAADGPRLLAILIEKDLAGAWHQRQLQHARLFQIMANLRTYAAKTYHDLPRVLPRPTSKSPPKSKLGSLKVRRFAYRGDWRGHFNLWRRRARHIETCSGVRIDLIPTRRDDDIDDLRQADLLHVAVRGQPRITDDQRALLKNYIQQGGFVLIESTDGQSEGNLAVIDLVKQIDVGQQIILDRTHDLVTGNYPGGAALNSLNPTPAGASLLTGGAIPPLLGREFNGELRVIACPFDISAALDRHHIWQRVGLDGPSTDRLISNILTLRLHQKASAKVP